MMTNNHSFFTNPTPKQFYRLMLIYLALAFVLGCFLTNGGIVFIATLLSLIPIVGVHNFSTEEKVQDKKAIGKDALSVFAMPLIMLFLAVTGSDLFSRPLPLQKSQLETTTGIVPESAYYAKGTKGGGYFLLINGMYFVCSDNYYSTCSDIYQHKGKMATVYYGRQRVYEIVVKDNPPIAVYEFDKELKYYQEFRSKNRKDWFFAFLIYVLPAVYFYVMYQRAVSHLIEVSGDELDEFLLEQAKPKPDIRVKYDDYDGQGLLIYVLGMVLLAVCIMIGVVVLFKQSWIGFVVWLPMLMLAIVMMYVPYQTAKYHRDIRLNLIDDYDDELSDGLENRQIFIQKIVVGVLLLLCLLFLSLGILALFEWEVGLVMFCGSALVVLGFLIKSLW